MLPSKLDLLPHEIAHYQELEKLAGECTLFLKRENHAFPIKKPCRVALFGNGARYTAKGGTGSGDVNSHFFINIEEELENRGFEITTKEWLDKYDIHRKGVFERFVKIVKEEAKELGVSVPAYSVGQYPNEIHFDEPIDKYDGDIAIYVLTRVSGEGADRRYCDGDVFLTKSEIENILYLNKKFEKFILVLNVAEIVDLSRIKEVKNILLLSQLGVVTSSILVDIILGKINPSGKLSDSWADPKDYPHLSLHPTLDDNYYLEDIFVGYRYHQGEGILPFFPFGYGRSYSDFKLSLLDYKVVGDEITLKVNVENTSDYDGKEVVQLYLRMEAGIETPYSSLVAFKKTDVIKAHQSEEFTISFKLRDFPVFDDKRASYILPQGLYLVTYGNSSANQDYAVKLEVSKDIIVKEVQHIKETRIDCIVKPQFAKNISLLSIPCIKVDPQSISPEKVTYLDKYQVEVSDFIKSLSLEDVIHLNLGDYKPGIAGIIGQNGSLVPGAAGETTLRVKSINTAISMADGPAGLRLIPEYKLTHKGTYDLQEDSIWKGIKPYLPRFLTKILDVKKNYKKKGDIVYQYCTAIPVATALAQSFNPDLVYEIGRLVGREMQIYDVELWLAPGINIHRSIMCGRNFEYYSEDPYLTGVIGAAIVNGVQSIEGRMCCIKHYCCNNFETNRFNSSSNVSERALREIYLPAFDYVIKHAKPAALMTSYNLVNGEHTSCSRDLLIKVLRSEMKYQGLVLTDWIASGQINFKQSKYPCKYAHQDLANGVNLVMPGSKKDIADIYKGLKAQKISVADLQNNAEIVYRFIMGEK